VSAFRGLKPALREARTPDDVRRALLRATGPVHAALITLVRHAPAWDEALALMVLTSGSDSREMLENPAMPAALLPLVATWHVARLHWKSRPTELEQAREALGWLVERGHLPADGEHWQTLLELAAPAGEKPSTTFGVDQRTAFDIVLDAPALPAELFERLRTKLRRVLGEAQWVRLSTHPACPKALRREIVQKHLSAACESGTVPALVACDALRLDPKIRPLLGTLVGMQGASSRVFRAFVLDFLEADCRDYFLRLLRSRMVAAEVLAEHGERLAPFLRQDDLTPLLSSSHAAVRLAAIRTIAQLPPRPGAVEFARAGVVR
jgi:hypothetical protein